MAGSRVPNAVGGSAWLSLHLRDILSLYKSLHNRRKWLPESLGSHISQRKPENIYCCGVGEATHLNHRS